MKRLKKILKVIFFVLLFLFLLTRIFKLREVSGNVGTRDGATVIEDGSYIVVLPISIHELFYSIKVNDVIMYEATIWPYQDTVGVVSGLPYDDIDGTAKFWLGDENIDYEQVPSNSYSVWLSSGNQMIIPGANLEGVAIYVFGNN